MISETTEAQLTNFPTAINESLFLLQCNILNTTTSILYLHIECVAIIPISIDKS